MKIRRPKLLLSILAVALVCAVWFSDPSAILLRLKYPHAKIYNCHEYRWLVPGFLYSRWAPVDDLYFGRYLSVEFSDQSGSADLTGIAESPVFLVVFSKCQVSDISALTASPYISAVFNNCELSDLPDLQRRELYPLPGVNRYSLNSR